MTTITQPVRQAAEPGGKPLTHAQWREVLRGQRLPAAVVDLDAFDRNVRLFARILESSGGKQRLRVATKSVRVPELMRRILDFGPPYQGLMAYSGEEAGFLAELGFDDLFVAYPTVQAADLAALRNAHESGKTVRLIFDSIDQAKAASSAMQGVRRPFPMVIDVDLSLRLLGGRIHFGVRRSPIRSVESVVALWEAAERLPGLTIDGLMGYEAQVAGLPDQNPFHRRMAPVIRWIRARSARHAAALRSAIRDELARRNHTISLYNGGGTGSADITPREPWLTEVTVGSGFLCSHLFSYFSNVHPEPACFFALQVVRTSDPGMVTCQGGGFIASGEPGPEKAPLPYLPEGLRLIGMEGCGEVQTPLLLPSNTRIRHGDPVLFRHAKAGELAEHFNEYLLVSGGKIVDRARTYRGHGKCFIG